MKFKLTCCVLFVMLVPFLPVLAQLRHALIIAVGNYPAAGGWPVLASNRDLTYIKAALTRQQFKEEDILTVVDQQATSEGIASAFTRLIDKVSEGDVVVIHVSSHGEQVEDDNN